MGAWSQRPRRRGQALLELAVVVPVLLVLLLGVLQFGIINNATIVLSQLSREGGRYAAAHANDNSGGTDPDSKINDHIRVAAQGTVIDYKDIQKNITITPGKKSRTVGQPITVSITYPMAKKFFVPKSFPGLSTISTETVSCTMRIEQ